MTDGTKIVVHPSADMAAGLLLDVLRQDAEHIKGLMCVVMYSKPDGLGVRFSTRWTSGLTLEQLLCAAKLLDYDMDRMIGEITELVSELVSSGDEPESAPKVTREEPATLLPFVDHRKPTGG